MGILTAAGLLTALCYLVGNGQAAEVCYPEIGCFTDDGCNAPGYPPDSPEMVNTRFFLYTRSNPDTYQELYQGDTDGLDASNFDSSKKTKFSVHGWNSDSDGSGEVGRKNAFLQAEDCNMIMVDWRDGAAGANYPHQAQNTRVAGRVTGAMIQFLVTKGMQYGDVHMVGHSLGSHVCGFAGEYLGGVVARITGTDPAGPSFVDTEPNCRLDPTDAVFVDAIHVDAGQLGIAMMVGHQDYFPNGGEQQPSCTKQSDVFGCSHAYADQYFNESVTSTCEFTAFPCASEADANAGLCNTCDGGCSEMGYHADEYKQLTGSFYLVTNAQSPFCVG